MKALLQTLLKKPIWPFWILVALGVLVLVLVIWWLLRSRKPKTQDKSSDKKPSGQTLRTQAQTWISSVLGALRYLTTSTEWRYQSPWVILLGPRSGGKSSLAGSIHDGRREQLLLRERELPVEGTTWHFFSGGVLIDPEGKLLVADAAADPSSAADEAKWQGILATLNQHRPERPMDAAVLAIPAASLLDPDPDQRQTLAEHCYRQLWQLQKQFEFVLPVYLVITRCDEIRGYDAFWATQPVERRRELWGWSTPSLQDYEAPQSLARMTFRELDTRLRQLQIEAASGRDQIDQADDFFLFPQRLGQLEAPLGRLLETLLQPSAYHASFYFRGVYFTGCLAQAGVLSGQPLAQVNFADDLFGQKIFREQHLARPLRQSWLSRNQLIRRVQIAGLVTAAAMTAFLLWSAVRLKRETEALKEAFIKVRAVSTERLGDRCIEKPTVYSVLDSILGLRADLKYAAFPASWLDSRVADDAGLWLADQAFREVVMPSIACRLEREAARLAGTQTAIPSGTLKTTAAMAAARSQLEQYLDDANTLERDLDRFRTLARTGGQSEVEKQLRIFDALARDVYGSPPPSQQHPPDPRSVYAQALTRMDYPEGLTLPGGFKAAIVKNLTQLANTLHDRLLERISLGSTLLAKLDGGEAPVPEGIDDFEDWLGWIRSSWLDSTAESNACSNITRHVAESAEELQKQHGYPASLDKLDDAFMPAQCYAEVEKRLVALTFPPHGPMFVKQDGIYRLTPEVAAEVAGLPVVRKLSLLQTSPRRSFVCQSAASGWRDAELGQAMSYLDEYQRFATSQKLDGVHSTSPPLYDRLARRQLELVLDDVLSDAQDPPAGSQASSKSEDGETRVQKRSTSFAHQQGTFHKICSQTEALGLGTAVRLNRCVRADAFDMLVRIDTLAEASRLYAPKANDASDGSDDGSAATSTSTPSDDDYIYDLPDDDAALKDWLQRHLDRAAVLAGYAEPFVGYLENSPATAAANHEASPAYWRNTTAEIKRARERKDPTGTVAELETYFSKVLSMLEYHHCAALLQKAGAGPSGLDLFSERRRKLHEESQWRCRDRRETDAYMRYRALATRFNRELAGQFPFASVTARDADLAVARAFFRDYAAERAALADVLADLPEKRWGEIRRFLGDLDTLSAWFAPTLAAPEGTKPIALDVSFRDLPGWERGAEQLIGWRLATSSALLDYPGTSKSALEWAFGQPLGLELTWAAQSIWRPRADIAQLDLYVSALQASFAGPSPWGLLRLIRQHHPLVAPDTDPLDPKRVLLEFVVPTQGPVPQGKAKGQAQALTAQTRVYLGLGMGTVYPRNWPHLAPTYW